MDDELDKPLIERIKRRRVTKKKCKIKKKYAFYKCDVCSRQFTSKKYLASHRNVHSSSNTYSCQVCAFSTNNKKYLARHMKRHKPALDNKCHFCDKTFYFPSAMRKHERIHTGEKPHKCIECGKTFNSKYSLSTHKYIHTGQKPYQCSFCEYACRDSSTLRKHQNIHMGINKLYQCKMCSKCCKCKSELKTHVAEKHLNIDVKKHFCDLCGKGFKRRANRNIHIQLVHLKSKAIKCEICSLEISNSNNLHRHMMTHVDARPFVCDVAECGASYKSSSSLAKHRCTHFVDLQFGCEVCGKMFTRKIRMLRHMQTHDPKRKNVECDYCGVRFYNKNYLTVHIQKKHMGRRKSYKCDICGLKTYTKPSLVMHLKYGHLKPEILECRVCYKEFKKPWCLKSHVKKMHGPKRKASEKKTEMILKEIEIKEEITEEVESIDLFEIEKEEPLDEVDFSSEIPVLMSAELETEQLDEASNPVLTEDGAKNLIQTHRVNLNRVPETVFDEFYIQRIQYIQKSEDDEAKPDAQKKIKPTKPIELNKNSREYADRRIEELLGEVRKKRQIESLETTRMEYNERIKHSLNANSKKDTTQIKYFNVKTSNKSDDHQINPALGDKNPTDDASDTIDQSLNTEESQTEPKEKDSLTNEKDSLNDEKEGKNETDDANNTNNKSNDVINANTNVRNLRSLNKKTKTTKTDDCNNTSDENDVDINDNRGKNKKVTFNTHQCYICFTLYKTKDELIDHCKEHFDVCNKVALKKCPFCDYVCKYSITRHIRIVHNVAIKRSYGKLKDKMNNVNGCRYYYKIDNPEVSKIEIIPSIKNLNKIAATNIDRTNREKKSKLLAKTKLKRKVNGEWVVEKEKINFNVNDFMLPEIGDVDSNSMKLDDPNHYFDKMKKLYKIAKKNGKKMLFPCEKCDKICQNMSALKLHWRKHDPNAKPFKKKVWKHKMKKIDEDSTVVTKPKLNIEHRTAEPKPIVNKHKCDPELKEFYMKNIRGSDIEFWQFLKIYNRMGRENVEDFDDLEGRIDFGIHFKEKDNEDIIHDDEDNIVEKAIENVTESESVNVVNTNRKVSSTTTSSSTKDTMQMKNVVTANVPNSLKALNKRIDSNEVIKYKRSYKRVIRISKKDYDRRNEIKNKLREKIADGLG